MGMDRYLSEFGVKIRKDTAKVMEENYTELNKHYDASTFPMFMLEKIKPLGINGVTIKGNNSVGLSCLEGAVVSFEMAKKDASFVTGFTIHNLSVLTINLLGNEEQKSRLIPPCLSLDKILGFGLTEPGFGSFATGL